MNVIAQWCNKIYPWFQSSADKIKSWELPPKVEALFDEVWAKMPADIQAKTWALVKKIYDEYGPAIAAALLAKILAEIKAALAETA